MVHTYIGSALYVMYLAYKVTYSTIFIIEVGHLAHGRAAALSFPAVRILGICGGWWTQPLTIIGIILFGCCAQ